MKKTLRKIWESPPVQNIWQSPRFQNGLASTTAAWALYTPPFAFLEVAQGYGWDTVTSRAIALPAQAVAGITTQYSREWIGKKLNIFYEQGLRKRLTTVALTAGIQPLTYLAVIKLNSLAHNYSVEEYAQANKDLIGWGLLMACAGSFFFEDFVDGFWKKRIFKSNPTFRKRDLEGKLEETA